MGLMGVSILVRDSSIAVRTLFLMPLLVENKGNVL